MIPERIICLTEEYVEFLYLLNEEKKIAGISSFVKRPPQAIKEKPIISSFIKANINRINELKPDLILGFSDLQAEIAKELILNHHNVFISNQRSINEIFNVLYWVGCLINKKNETEELIQKWKNKIHYYQNKVRNIDKNYKVFFQEWDEPIISGIQWVEEILEILNVKPIFPKLKYKKSAKERIVSREMILEKNPDIILTCWCGKKTNFDWVKNEFSSTNAIKNNKIFELPPEILLQPGPALFEEGIDLLYQIIYEN